MNQDGTSMMPQNSSFSSPITSGSSDNGDIILDVDAPSSTGGSKKKLIIIVVVVFFVLLGAVILLANLSPVISKNINSGKIASEWKKLSCTLLYGKDDCEIPTSFDPKKSEYEYSYAILNVDNWNDLYLDRNTKIESALKVAEQMNDGEVKEASLNALNTIKRRFESINIYVSYANNSIDELIVNAVQSGVYDSGKEYATQYLAAINTEDSYYSTMKGMLEEYIVSKYNYYNYLDKQGCATYSDFVALAPPCLTKETFSEGNKLGKDALDKQFDLVGRKTNDCYDIIDTIVNTNGKIK